MQLGEGTADTRPPLQRSASLLGFEAKIMDRLRDARRLAGAGIRRMSA